MPEQLKITKSLDPVIADIKEWPIYKLSQNKDSFLKEVIDLTIDSALSKFPSNNELHSEIKNILYQEKIRLTKTPWKSDSPSERIFGAK